MWCLIKVVKLDDNFFTKLSGSFWAGRPKFIGQNT